MAKSNSSTAFTESQDFITRQLRSPSTASYPSYRASGVYIERQAGSFYVKAYVDAQNAFGGMVRSAYIVIQPTLSSYTVIMP